MPTASVVQRCHGEKLLYVGSVSDLLTTDKDNSASTSAGSENVLMIAAAAAGDGASRTVSKYENSWVECQHAILLPDVKQLGSKRNATFYRTLALT